MLEGYFPTILQPTVNAPSLDHGAESWYFCHTGTMVYFLTRDHSLTGGASESGPPLPFLSQGTEILPPRRYRRKVSPRNSYARLRLYV